MKQAAVCEVCAVTVNLQGRAVAYSSEKVSEVCVCVCVWGGII